MKRLLLAITLFLLPSVCWAQCNGIFGPNTACGTIAGGLPGQIPFASFPTGTPAGTNGQTQYNNAGALGAYTPSQDCTVVPTTGVFTCLKTNNVAFSTLATLTPAAGIATWLGTPSSANLAAALTDETGTGTAVFANTPTLVAPILGAATATTINSFSFTRGTTSTASFAIGDTTTAPSMNGASDNIAIGTGAGLGLTTGTQNVLIGSGNGGALINDTGNTFVGYLIGQNLHNAVTPNNFNTAIGNQALRTCTTCGSNVAVGRASMLAATVDDHNTGVGHATLFTGSANVQVTAIGDSAGGTALAGTAIPAGFPNVGVNVFPFTSDNNLECIGESCGKTSSAARKQSFAIGSYSRIPANDNSAWLGNGLSVIGTKGQLWTGATNVNVSSATGVTLTAAQVLSGFIDRTGGAGAGFSDTLPTAQQIIQSAAGGPGNGCETPISKQFTYGNRGTTQTATIVTNTGITLASTTGTFTVPNNTGSTWQMIITNCASGSEAITVFRTN